MASKQPAGWKSIVLELRKGIVPFVFAAIGGLVVAVPTYVTSNRQMDVKMVEIAVNILSQKPEPNIQPARYWAVDVIMAYSKVPLPPEVQTALIENRALGVTYGSGSLYGGYGSGTVYGGVGWGGTTLGSDQKDQPPQLPSPGSTDPSKRP